MKKSLLLILIILIGLITGCQNQEQRQSDNQAGLNTNEESSEMIAEVPENKVSGDIVGTWQEDKTDSVTYFNLTFGSDGIFHIYEISLEKEAIDPNNCTIKSAFGEYSIKNNQVSLTYQDIETFSEDQTQTRIVDTLKNTTVVYTYLVDGDKLTLTDSQNQELSFTKTTPE